MPAITRPGKTPASQRSDTGWRAMTAKSTMTTDGGKRMPSVDPP